MKVKNLVFILAGAAASCVLAFSLAGCSSGGDVKSASEPVSASKAFGQQSVWVQYGESEGIDKDGALDRILVFDGSGNVTAYQCDDATFADLNGLSDDEIIALAKEQDKAAFDASKQSAMDSTAEAAAQWQADYDTLKSELDNGTYESAIGDRPLSDLSEDEIANLEENYDDILSDLEAAINAANDGQAASESREYQEPQPQPFALHIETDGSGNSTQSETISFDAPSYSFYTAFLDDEDDDESSRLRTIMSFGPSGGAWPAGDEVTNVGIDLQPVEKQAVYDTTFGGYGGIATIVDEGHAGFVFDEPGAEGVSVD